MANLTSPTFLNVISKVLSRRTFSTTRAAAAQQMTVRDALNSAIDEEMQKDERVFILGKES